MLVDQSCTTLYNPMDCSSPSPSVHEDSAGKNTGVGCHFLLQKIFLTQTLNHCRQILYCLSYQGSPLHSRSFKVHLLSHLLPTEVVIALGMREA